MKELNELVELAKEMGGESWEYRRTTPYSRGYITGKDGRTIVQTTSGEVPANVCRFIEMADPETILAIAEAFRALEQRAEAAEASAKEWRKKALTQCAKREVAESKLAELEKQEPVADVVPWRHPNIPERTCDVNLRFFDLKPGPLFPRPAPAVSLAELVPECIAVPASLEHDLSEAEKNAWISGENEMRAAMLRKIEEAK